VRPRRHMTASWRIVHRHARPWSGMRDATARPWRSTFPLASWSVRCWRADSRPPSSSSERARRPTSSALPNGSNPTPWIHEPRSRLAATERQRTWRCARRARTEFQSRTTLVIARGSWMAPSDRRVLQTVVLAILRGRFSNQRVYVADVTCLPARTGSVRAASPWRGRGSHGMRVRDLAYERIPSSDPPPVKRRLGRKARGSARLMS